MSSITLRLSDAQAGRLKKLLPLYGRTAEDLIERTFTDMLTRLEDDYQSIAEVDDAFERGEFFTHEEVVAHVDKILARRD